MVLGGLEFGGCPAKLKHKASDPVCDLIGVALLFGLCMQGCIPHRSGDSNFDGDRNDEKLLARIPDGLAVGGGSISFSTTMQRVAYKADTGHGWIVVGDNGHKERFDEVWGAPVFSNDGVSVAFAASKNGKTYIVLDGKKSEPYDWAEIPRFHPRTNKIVYRAQSGGKEFLVSGGVKGPELDTVGPPVFVPQSGKIAYCGVIDDQGVFVVGEETTKGFDRVWGLTFSPDGKSLAYAARLDSRQFIIVNGKRGREFESVKLPVFAPDGKAVAFVAQDGEKEFIIWGDKEAGPKFDEIAGFSFNLDGTSLAYAAREGGEWEQRGNQFLRKGERWFVVADGKKGEEYDGMGVPFYSPAGILTFVAARDGKFFFVTDGKEGREFDKIIWPPTFSRDGTVMSYLGVVGGKEAKGPEYPWKGGKWFVVVGQKLSSHFERAYLGVFAEDDKSIGFGVRQGSELWWKVVQVHE